MEPHKDMLPKTPELRTDARKSRFQIVKLEERIAPRRGYHPTPRFCKLYPQYCASGR